MNANRKWVLSYAPIVNSHLSHEMAIESSPKKHFFKFHPVNYEKTRTGTVLVFHRWNRHYVGAFGTMMNPIRLGLKVGKQNKDENLALVCDIWNEWKIDSVADSTEYKSDSALWLDGLITSKLNVLWAAIKHRPSTRWAATKTPAAPTVVQWQGIVSFNVTDRKGSNMISCRFQIRFNVYSTEATWK